MCDKNKILQGIQDIVNLVFLGVTQVGADVVIDISAMGAQYDDILLLQNINASEISTFDFLF